MRTRLKKGKSYYATALRDAYLICISLTDIEGESLSFSYSIKNDKVSEEDIARIKYLNDLVVTGDAVSKDFSDYEYLESINIFAGYKITDVSIYYFDLNRTKFHVSLEESVDNEEEDNSCQSTQDKV